MVHREHQHMRLHHDHSHKHHKNNNNNQLHRRQSVPAVTQVTTTIAVIAQVEVDSNGAIIRTDTYLAESRTVLAPTGLSVVGDDNTGTSSTSTPLDTSATPTPAAASSAVSNTGTPSSIQSLPSGQSSTLTSPLSSASAASTNAVSSGIFPPTVGNSSSVTLAAASPSSNQTASSTRLFNNSSSTSFTLSTTSSSSSSSSSILMTTFTPSSTASSTSSDFLGPGAAGSATNSATSTAAAGVVGGGTGSAPASPGAIAGGVVGGVAGLAFLVLLALAFLRWRRKRQSLLPLGSGTEGTVSATVTASSTAEPRQMEDRSMAFAIPATLARLTGSKRQSDQPSIAGQSSTAGSERGFYRVSGRKIPSVLTSGGDGYGGGSNPRDTQTSDSSYYRSSHGTFSDSGLASPSLAGPLAAFGGPTFPRDRISDVPPTRPSPARTPHISQGPFADPAPVFTPPSPSSTPPPRPSPLVRPDMVGRSHPSQDGSRNSRFKEQME